MYLFFWYKLLPLEINFSILLDSGLIFQDCHEDVLKVLPHWKSLIPHSFDDLPALILEEHTDHDGENINLKKNVLSVLCESISLFSCVFWPNLQLLAHSCMWLLFCQTIKPVLLKIIFLFLFFFFPYWSTLTLPSAFAHQDWDMKGSWSPSPYDSCVRKFKMSFKFCSYAFDFILNIFSNFNNAFFIFLSSCNLCWFP